MRRRTRCRFALRRFGRLHAGEGRELPRLFFVARNVVFFPEVPDYLGYLQKGPKVAACLAPQGGSAAWALKDASGAVVTTGTSTDYVAKDFASGDSFFRIDFSSFEGAGKGAPSKLTHVSFASWNDGPGTFYIDNVR